MAFTGSPGVGQWLAMNTLSCTLVELTSEDEWGALDSHTDREESATSWCDARFRDICGCGYNLYPALMLRRKPSLSRVIIRWALTPPPATGLFAGLMCLQKCLGPLSSDVARDEAVVSVSKFLGPSGLSGALVLFHTGCWQLSSKLYVQDSSSPPPLHCAQPQSRTPPSPASSERSLSPPRLAHTPHLLSWRACGCDVTWWETTCSGRQ